MSLVFRSRGLFGPEVTLNDERIRSRNKSIAWSAIDHYRYEWHQPSRPGDLLVVSRDNVLIRLAPHFERFSEVSDFFVEHAHPHLRAAPSFAPFAFDGDDLVCKPRRIAASMIDHVTIAPIDGLVAVVILARDGSEWARYDVMQIASFWLWLELLRDRGVSVQVEEHAQQGARVALPFARVVQRK